MAIEKKVIINVETKGIEVVNSEVQKLEQGFKDVKKEAAQADGAIDDVTKNGGAIAILDSLTGGLATKFRDVYEASKLFNFQLGAMRTALIATGIGALVVALGFVVAYWDEIVEFITQANAKLEEQLRISEEVRTNLELEMKLLQAKAGLLDKEPGLLAANLVEQKKIQEAIQKQLEHEIDIAKLQLQKLKDKETELGWWVQIKAIASEVYQPGSSIAIITRAQLDAKKLTTQKENDIKNLEIKQLESLKVVSDATRKAAIDANALYIQNLNLSYDLLTAGTTGLIDALKADSEELKRGVEDMLLPLSKRVEYQDAYFENEKKIARANILLAKDSLDLIEKEKQATSDITELKKLNILDVKAFIELKKAEWEQQNLELRITKEIYDLNKEIIKANETEKIADIKNTKRLLDAKTDLINNDKLYLEQKLINLETEQKLEEDRLIKIRDSYALGTQLRVDAEVAITNNIVSSYIEREKLLKDLDQVTLDDDMVQFEVKRGILQQQEDSILLDQTITEELRTQMLKDNTEARIELSKLEAQAKIAGLESYADSLGKIGSIFGKQTAANKALSVAAALISTYTSATKAYESQLTIPTPDAPIRAALAAAAAVVTGLANVKAIIAVKVPGASGGSSSSVGSSVPNSTASSLPPKFNVVGTGSTNQLAQSICEKSNKPIKAYVVSTDMTTQQDIDRSIQQGATFGG